MLINLIRDASVRRGMEVYLVEHDDLKQLPETELAREENLEERLVRTEGAKIGDVEVLYVGRQGSPGEGGIFDILGVDEQGDAVIVELKRGRAPRDIVAQALEYAGEIRNVDYGYLNDRYQEFLREEHGYRDPSSIPPLQEAHADYFDLDDPLDERKFNGTQRLVVVGTAFGDVSLNMADFLREHGIDVVAVEYSTYRAEEESIELLTTDGIRRPLSQEPASVSSSTTTSGPDYTEFNARVRDRVFQKVGSLINAEKPEDLSGRASRRLAFRSQHPEHPYSAVYGAVPEIEDDGTVIVRVGVYGGDDDEKQRVYQVIAKNIDGLEDFEMVSNQPKQAIAAKPVQVDEEEPYGDATVERVATKLARIVEFYHPKFIEAFSGTSDR